LLPRVPAVPSLRRVPGVRLRRWFPALRPRPGVLSLRSGRYHLKRPSCRCRPLVLAVQWFLVGPAVPSRPLVLAFPEGPLLPRVPATRPHLLALVFRSLRQALRVRLRRWFPALRPRPAVLSLLLG